MHRDNKLKRAAALEKCSEDRCNEECACYMEDDCRIKHLTEEEARVVFRESAEK